MKKILPLLIIIGAIYWSFYTLLPNSFSGLDTDINSFSSERALIHLKNISKTTHYVGTEEHAVVKDYIINELKNLGLSVELQEGYTISKWGNLVKAKNILSRIEGTNNSKALLLLTHYDSASHSSYGASDAGSGVVTILEGIRAYLSQGLQPKNDIIILFSDAEELGLNGADLFVNQHKWAKDVGIVLNFEARGSSGPSYMLVETNGGNSKLIEAFKAAKPNYPVANSLAYSIYKMLPNDTDLTRFREDGDIDGFNFAFIDDHFDYHTSNDTFENLDKSSLEHQASYLMPLLTYLSEVNLQGLKTKNDDIYFNIPVIKLINYPFNWIWPMLIIAILLFSMLVFYGIQKRRLLSEDILKGWLPLLGSLILSGGFSFLLWRFLLWFYPGYSEMLHGFTYNGHTYIWAFVFMTIGICFYMYSKYYKPGNTASFLVPPITLWIIICVFAAIKLKGASFFVIPVYFAITSLFVLVRQRKPNLALMALLCVPLLVIMSPFVKMFPVGLGLNILYVSSIFVVLIFALLTSVFGFFRHKRRWSIIMFMIAVIFFISAHFQSSFNKDRQKPNSLVYILDSDQGKATWATYDNVLDSWTKNFLGNSPVKVSELTKTAIASKYNTNFTFTSEAPVKPLLEPSIEILKDTVVGDSRELSIHIKSNRDIDRIEFFASEQNIFKEFTANGVDAYKENDNSFAFENRIYNRLFTYYVVDSEPLEMHFTIPKNQITTIEFFESSADLLNNKLFTVPKRDETMMPKPFVLNDAILIKKTIVIE